MQYWQSAAKVTPILLCLEMGVVFSIFRNSKTIKFEYYRNNGGAKSGLAILKKRIFAAT